MRVLDWKIMADFSNGFILNVEIKRLWNTLRPKKKLLNMLLKKLNRTNTQIGIILECINLTKKSNKYCLNLKNVELNIGLTKFLMAE